MQNSDFADRLIFSNFVYAKQGVMPKVMQYKKYNRIKQ